jgi:hypothetical protein
MKFKHLAIKIKQLRPPVSKNDFLTKRFRRLNVMHWVTGLLPIISKNGQVKADCVTISGIADNGHCVRYNDGTKECEQTIDTADCYDSSAC